MRRIGLSWALFAMGLALATPAAATSIPERTFRISVAADGGDANGASTRPTLSATGELVAFESVATNLAPDPNGAVADVFLRDLVNRRNRLLSQSTDPSGANGPSRFPVLARKAGSVAFESDASNLMAGDTNGVTDVFVALPQGGVLRASVAHNGEQADGPSSSPDISDNGRLVVFTSRATNLVPGDTNGRADVFVRDLVTNQTRLVSVLRPLEMNGDSTGPAISPDGRYVSFSSTNPNLVFDDGNRKGDVFAADLQTGRIRRVSVSGVGEEQNQAVAAPFVQVSDISAGGRLVVFDSDATNLVERDRNKDTDVFLRQRTGNGIVRASLDVFGREGSNDSFFPRITPDGRFVAFQSFASNFSSDDVAREDIFVYDFRRFAPTLVSVGATGQRREPESVSQLLQRPDITADGQIVAFTSTAGNLVTGDANRSEDVFLRLIAAPRARIVRPRRVERSTRPRLRLTADDPRATRFLCVIDGVRLPCRRNGRLPALRPGRHQLRVLAGGAGMLFQEGRGTRRVFTIRR